jgi:hypothetical protein
MQILCMIDGTYARSLVGIGGGGAELGGECAAFRQAAQHIVAVARKVCRAAVRQRGEAVRGAAFSRARAAGFVTLRDQTARGGWTRDKRLSAAALRLGAANTAAR